MSRHDYDIGQQHGLAFLGDISAALAAVASLNADDAPPVPTFPGMFWLDTGTNVLFQRDPADDVWLPLLRYDTAAGTFVRHGGFVRTVSANTTLTVHDAHRLIAADASQGDLTVTLPAVATTPSGTPITVAKTDTGTSAVIVDGATVEEIDNFPAVALVRPGESVTLRGDGAKWSTARQALRRTLGRCRLTYTSASVITLLPWGGNVLTLAGADRRLPAAGITLPVTGLSAGTLYYVYAYWSGSAVALEASTTGHATDAASGQETKSGDPTRALVGMVVPVSGPSFADSDAQRLVRSWYQDSGIAAQRLLPSHVAHSVSNAWFEVSADLRIEALLWSGERVKSTFTGCMLSSLIGYSWYIFPGVGIPNSLPASPNYGIGGVATAQASAGYVSATAAGVALSQQPGSADGVTVFMSFSLTNLPSGQGYVVGGYTANCLELPGMPR